MKLSVYLVHWPVPLNPNGNHPVFPTLPNGKRDVYHEWKLTDTWKQMEEMVKKGEIISPMRGSLTYSRSFEGKVKSIGVSNFSEAKLEEILPTAEIIPVVDQVGMGILFLRTFADLDRNCSWSCTCITPSTS